MGNHFKVILVVGARPNFMKVAPIYHAMEKNAAFKPVLVHTGQHYDLAMSDNFLKDLKLPSPDTCLGIGSGSHAEQTARIILAFEKVCLDIKPSWIIVVGDVNSTLAASLVAVKLRIKLAHVEAGLRSFDRSMPEEINRLVTDTLSDLLFTFSFDAGENLKKEGIESGRIHLVGNVMIDALEMVRPQIINNLVLDRFGYGHGDYFLLTAHRPSNVDNPVFLERLISIFKDLTSQLNCIFPVHPRTRKGLQENKLWDRLLSIKGIIVTEPLRYIDFMGLMIHTKFIITDSGGIQEEATYLGIPCITLRENTERPITILEGTNELSRLDDLPGHVARIISGNWKKGRIPPLWDGKAAERILGILLNSSLDKSA